MVVDDEFVLAGVEADRRELFEAAVVVEDPALGGDLLAVDDDVEAAEDDAAEPELVFASRNGEGGLQLAAAVGGEGVGARKRPSARIGRPIRTRSRSACRPWPRPASLPSPSFFREFPHFAACRNRAGVEFGPEREMPHQGSGASRRFQTS